jgi:two-component system response regulator AlgR
MNILIVDDELPARERLSRMLAVIPGCILVGEAANGAEAIAKAETLKPDLVLMDIRMPGMDGIEAARHLSTFKEPPAVIFTTAFAEHAFEAFETHAVAYLLKPIRQQKLEQAVAQASALNRAQIAALGGGGRTHLCARVRGNLKLIPIEEILYFRADQKYVTVRHMNGEVLIEEALKSLENEFAAKFLRVHRNALVAKEYIQGLEKRSDGSLEIVLKGSSEHLEVSRRHSPDVRRYLTGED